MARPSDTDGAIGFSTSTCTPRLIAVSASSSMQVGRRGDGDGIDAHRQQRFGVV